MQYVDSTVPLHFRLFFSPHPPFLKIDFLPHYLLIDVFRVDLGLTLPQVGSTAVAHVAGWIPDNFACSSAINSMFLGLGLNCVADPAQPLTTAGEELHHLSVDR